MEVVEVEGTEIAPEDATFEAGWISSHRNKQRKHALNAPASPTGQGSASDTPMLNGSAQRLPREPRQPRLPDDHVETETYDVRAYVTSSENTAKGVIHNISLYDFPEDISASLVNDRNPTILQARRMGKANTLLIVFDGDQVSFHVYYRGAEYKCYLHKKRTEACDKCGAVGHHSDVCPKPNAVICTLCTMLAVSMLDVLNMRRADPPYHRCASPLRAHRLSHPPSLPRIHGKLSSPPCSLHCARWATHFHRNTRCVLCVLQRSAGNPAPPCSTESTAAGGRSAPLPPRCSTGVSSTPGCC
ncbi:hypothetical protein HPB51_015763 [Rhipicephalus microplus]|uniref:CCHC-type domain-containing protein n=1 Tax=Rhipicephalus microplus TaxID=6941 RepID=A0A9J6ETR5_RHIMP|nr:hypothetical protein HPB51_015763 [Rhipicephalus microplus]